MDPEWPRHLFFRLAGIHLRVRTFYQNGPGPFLARIYAGLGFLSLALLIAEFGFGVSERYPAIVERALRYLVYGLLGYEILSFWGSPVVSLRLRFREHFLQIVVIVLASGMILLERFFLGSGFPRSYILLFLFINQAVLLFGAILHLARRRVFLRVRSIHPATVFVFSFAVVIFLGFLFLLLPRMHRPGVAAIDLFFTAVSAVCVTGLSTIDVAKDLTRPGQVVLLILIQVGGLGLMTLTTFFAYLLTGRASVRTRMLMRDLISPDSLGKVYTIVLRVAFLTFSFEGVGALYLYLTQPLDLPVSEKMFLAIFQSISAFCNAGFSLHPGSLAPVATPWHLVGYMVLITLGGLGFPVIMELLGLLRFRARLTLATRLVLLSSLFLFLSALLSVLVLERDGWLRDRTISARLLHAMFYSVTMRTAGFNTLDVAALGEGMTFLSCFFMWVGASPMSTGGGVKTTTLALALLLIVGQSRGRDTVDAFGREVARVSLDRALSTIVMSFFVIFAATMVLTLMENQDFLDLAFEVVSAYGTVGLSRGLTPDLTSVSKLLLCAVMLTGRVGVLTAVVAFLPLQRPVDYRYPVEYVAAG
ncbi:MAG: portal protein [Spirochaetales bacterium]|nr:portal protein [Spirochaetales bacterium]